MGHPGTMTFFSAVENESVGRMKYTFLSVGYYNFVVFPSLTEDSKHTQKMILPCGPPPKEDEVEDEDDDMET